MILPTLKQLQYLVALHDHGHFGRAADATFVPQSTLSAGLRELEGLLGVVLVERTRRVVRFTPLSIRIASTARRVLREAEAGSVMAREAGRSSSGQFERMNVVYADTVSGSCDSGGRRVIEKQKRRYI